MDTPTAAELAAYSLPLQHPVTRDWADQDTRLHLLAEQHEEDVLLATDHEIAALRATRFAPHLPAETFLNRWVGIGDGLSAMLSMRYEGGAPDRPFVDASVLSRAVRPADLDGLARAARAAYGSLRPHYLRLWSAEPVDAFAGTTHDKRFVAAPLAALRENAVPEAIGLRPTTDLSHYDDARGAYEAVDAAHPEHPEQAQLQDADELAESIEAGTMFDVLVDGDWAGYAAVTTGVDTLALPGFTVQELVLTPTARGHGFGAHLSSLLARQLPGDGVLIGTIDADNRGSVQGALRAGRHDVGGWFRVAVTQ